MTEVAMPRLSDSMEEGTIVRWLVADGAEVARGEEIVEIETDKATMPYEADVAGPLAIVAREGETVRVGAPIAHIGAPVPVAAGDVRAVSPLLGREVSARPPRAGVSSVARRVAARLGIDLAALVGSGPHGRIVKADVTAAAPAPAAGIAPRAVAPPAAPVAPPAAAGVTGQELTRTQALVARRMVESRATVPDFSLQVDVDMGAAVELRARLKAVADPAPSLNDLVVKACAAALRRHPRANGSFRDGRFELHDAVHVGVAVAAEDALVVPVVRDADARSLGAVAAETRRLAGAVRAGRIAPADLDGGTFTVSNLGMFGIDRFEGIVNAPQAAILCVGAVRDRPAALDGELTIRPQCTLTLACDHRILYGADAAAFLADVRAALEAPLTLAF